MADGLFSYKTPGQLQQEYLSNLIQPVGGGDLYSQLVQTMSNAGRMMGYGAGRMFGGQVPGEAKNAAIQSVFEQVKDIQDPAQQYTAASQLFLKAGFPDLAMQARKTAQTEKLTGYKLSDAEEYLISLDGVGPKTAACVLIFSFNFPIIPADTHVHRLSNRIGIVDGSTREKTQALLQEEIPDKDKYSFHLNLIEHGRKICKAKNPLCQECFLQDICDYYQEISEKNK